MCYDRGVQSGTLLSVYAVFIVDDRAVRVDAHHTVVYVVRIEERIRPAQAQVESDRQKNTQADIFSEIVSGIG